MSSPEIFYEGVKGLIRSGERPVNPQPIQLRNGQTLEGITPYAIAKTELNGKTTLGLFYLNREGRAEKIDVGEINGLSVVEGKGDYKGQLLLSFHYYKPNDDPGQQFVEEDPREILVTEIRYGANETHGIRFDERMDIYFVGYDFRYINKPADQRIRQFPWWRVDGLYGKSKQIEHMFKNNYVSNLE